MRVEIPGSHGQKIPEIFAANMVISRSEGWSIRMKRTISMIALAFGIQPSNYAYETQDKRAKVIQEIVENCKSSEQQITYEEIPRITPPISGPATEAEETQVKSLLAQSGMPYDKVNHRATYEFTLSLVRTVLVLKFRITPADTSEEYRKTLQCLEDLKKMGQPVEFKKGS